MDCLGHFINREGADNVSNEELVIRIKEGIDTADSMLQLWQQNRLFINRIARHYQGIAELEDLEQEGYLALYDAVAGFDVSKGYKFLTYAGYWITQRLQRYIYFQKLPKDGILSLDSRTITQDGEYTLGDIIPTDVNVEQDVLKDISIHHMQNTLWPLVDTLPGYQGRVLRLRYQGGKTRKAIGESLGITMTQVNTLESNALHNLKRSRKVRLLHSYLADDDAYSMGLVGNGVTRFNTTWTSSTERAAMRY